MRVGIVGGSIAGCVTAALLHRVGYDVIVFERSESALVSRGPGVATLTAAWQAYDRLHYERSPRLPGSAAMPTAGPAVMLTV
jgi:2-polyprenyl-6-methoxyphenol hydroxylase-like FAD-dependent oxidoreductase